MGKKIPQKKLQNPLLVRIVRNGSCSGHFLDQQLWQEAALAAMTCSDMFPSGQERVDPLASEMHPPEFCRPWSLQRRLARQR